MKIAYIHNCLWPSSIPSVNFVTYNAHGFGKAGYDFTLFVKNNSAQSTTKILWDVFHLQEENFSLQRIRPFKFFRTNRLYFHQVYQYIKHHPFDVLITRHSSFLPYLIKLKRYYLGKNKKVKIIYEPHDFYYDLSLRSDLSHHQINRSKRNQSLERKYLSSMDGLIFLQPNFKVYYERYLPEIAGVIAFTGVVKAHENRILPQKNRLIYIGSIEGKKYSGIYTVVRAMEFLPQEIGLTIIGGRNRQEIADLQQKIKPELRNRITITGWISRSDIEKIVLEQGRMALILFHHDFFADHFAYPLKFCDYISFGLPIMCSFSQENRLIQEDIHGLFFENDNPLDLADKIKLLWYDEKRLNEMSRQIHRLAEERLWEHRAKTIVEFLQALP